MKKFISKVKSKITVSLSVFILLASPVLSQSFDFNSSVSGNGTRIVSQVKENNTLSVKSEDVNLCLKSATSITSAYGGFTGNVVTTSNCMKKLTLSLAGGVLFNLDKIDIQERHCSNLNLVLTAKSGSDVKGSVTIAFSPSQGKTIDLSTNDIFKSITSVEITSTINDVCCGNYTYWIALDNIVISNVHQPLGVSSVSPDNGPVTGGTQVSIGGTGFQYVQAVKFGSVDAKSYTVNSGTKITAESPAAAAGTVDVTVITANGTSQINNNDKFTYYKLSQTIAFDNPGNQFLGTSPKLTATATSGLAPVFTSVTSDVCTVTTEGTLTLLKPGSCTINADQTGNDTYLAAPAVSQTFEVKSSVPGAPSNVTATAGNAQATVSFTAPVFDGGSAIVKYTVKSNDGIIAEGTSTTITVTGLTNGTSYTFTVTATNTNGEGPASASSNSVTPTCNQTISFTNPGDQVYGSALTLSATATSALPVTFISLTTDVCTVSGDEVTFKSAGTCTIRARQDGNHVFNPAPSVEQSFLVNPKTLTIHGLSAEDKVYDGTTTASLTGTAVLTGVVSPDNVTLSGTPLANFADAGAGTNKPVSVTGFTLTGDASAVDNYTLQQPAGLTADITKAAVALTWDQPADISYGTALGNVQLNATANIPGTFTYTPAAGTILNAGNAQALSVTFTPADLDNYQVVSKSVTINVTKASLKVTADNIQITYGNAVPPLTYHYSGFVNGENATVLDAEPVISVESASVNAGNYSIIVSGGSDNNYSFSYENGTLEIIKAAVALTWDQPADIIYGTALGNVQLNATANIAGTYTYTPAAGTILNAGNAQILSVTFTPADLNYQVVSKSVTINVTKASLKVTADNIQITYGNAVPPLTYHYSGFVNGENATVLDAEPVISVESTPVNAGNYSIIVSGGSDNNYSFSYENGTLTVNRAALSIGAPVLATSKTYDGNNQAVVTPGAISGVPSGEDVNVEVSAIYDNANVGTGKSITVSYVLTGADKDNYQTPASYVVTTGVITPKQLTITDPVVVTSKEYDGSTVATITSSGQLSGVVTGDESKVSVTPSANYNDASPGNNKTITVSYTLTGSAAGNYWAPVNKIITGASIVLKLSLSLENPKAGCEGGALQLPYTILEGSANSYRIIFADAAKAAGFSDIDFTQLTSGNTISIAIPDGIKDGIYEAFLQVKNDIVTSELYKFTFTVNLTSDYLVKKFNDVILVDNSTNRFTSYQWYKNGTILNGATGQFYNDIQGLSGTYHAVVKTVSGQTVEICPVTYNVASLKAMVSLKTYPNPVATSNKINIEVDGLSAEQLKGAVLSVFSNRGEKILTSAKVDAVNTITAGNTAGVYFVRLSTADGNVITQKITITQ